MRALGIMGLCLLLTAPASRRPTDIRGVPKDPPFSALIFSKTTGFRHDSIPDGIAAIKQLGEQYYFTADATEEAAWFNDTTLANYDVVIFLSTTGAVLDDSQKAAFQRFIRSNHGFVGVHSATDTEYDWPWYGQLVGAYFNGHPAVQTAAVRVLDPTHPSTLSLPAVWSRVDEWYNFRWNTRAQLHVLAALDEATYSGGTMGADHPISWWHDFDGGRAWYTGMGHTSETFQEPLFLDHLLGGIRTAAGVMRAGGAGYKESPVRSWLLSCKVKRSAAADSKQ